jgi:twitching motility protein PilT
MLAECLTGVVSQLLCRKKGGGRVAVHEILLRTDGLPNVIREGKISSLRTIIDAGGDRGMCSMEASLERELLADKITATEAYMKSTDKNRFREAYEAEKAAEEAALLAAAEAEAAAAAAAAEGTQAQ